MKTLKQISIHILLAGIFAVPFFLSAQTAAPIRIDIPNPATKAGNNLMDLLLALLNNVVMPIAAVLVVMYIIYAGFTFVTAQGKEKEISAAKQRLLWAL